MGSCFSSKQRAVKIRIIDNIQKENRFDYFCCSLKKTLAKILMCPCYAELFESNKKNKYVKKITDFYCK